MTIINNALNNTANNDFLVTTATAAVDRKLSITNTDNTAVYSAAHLQLTVGGTTSTGDPYVNFLVTAGNTFSAGIDNSDSGRFKLTTGATVSVGNTVFYATGGGAAQSVYFGVEDFRNYLSVVGGTTSIRVVNTDNTNAASDARLQVSSGGTSAGDPYVYWSLSGGGSFSLGIDNSDSDKWKLTNSAGPSAGTTAIAVTTVGEITMPAQPAFLAYLAGDASNKTGDGTAYTLGTDALTEVYDQNADFNVNGTFTAPVTGIYDLRANISIIGTTIAATFVISIVTTARTYTNTYTRTAGSTDQSMAISCLADMAAGNTATVTITVSGEAAATDDIDGAASCVTYFCGKLAC